ncbi:hypothetical protein SeLEV6574_g04495 [Synchytrium endobioticum]|uniref:Uncharacterized protein n=1 Tax=Synchytrium endobioticum TaxID=286115 RepID=A0A507CZ68_9FUNG|nr:hypothetical protein SeLEV6574_g04495 [Synchytrium endobioticum]
MATTTSCSIKAAAVLCLFWTVFLSASAAGNSEVPNLNEDELAQQAAFKHVGTFGDSAALETDPALRRRFQSYVKRMTRKFQAIYANLEPTLSEGIYPEDEDFMNLRDLRILVTTEKLPWDLISLTYAGVWKVEYNEYFGLFHDCVNLFDKHMVNVESKLAEIWENLDTRVRQGEYLKNDPHMEIMQRIIRNEEYIWDALPENWTPPPYSNSEPPSFIPYCFRCNNGHTLINTHKYLHRNRPNPPLPPSPMDSAPHGNPSLAWYNQADPSHNDHSEDVTSQNLQLGWYPSYTGDSNIDVTTRMAHVSINDYANPFSSYPGIDTPYPPTPHDPAGLFSPYPGIDTPYPPNPYDPAGPSGYWPSDPPDRFGN